MLRRPSCGLLVLLLIMSVHLLTGCDYFGKEKRPDLPAQDPVWSNFISAHASGLVSKKAKIRVVFVNDVVDKAMIGKSATSVISVDPSVDGSLTFISEREIALVPSADLTPGRYYRFTLKSKGLNGVPEGIGKYEFVVQVLAQEFEVNVAGLSSNTANDKEMQLKGSLVTADVDDADKIEKILSASFRQWVRPGDETLLHAEITTNTDTYANAECLAEVNGQPVAQAKLFFSFMPASSFAVEFRDAVLEDYLARQGR